MMQVATRSGVCLRLVLGGLLAIVLLGSIHTPAASTVTNAKPPAFVVPATIARGVVIRPDDGDSRVEVQPGGPFAAMVFRNGAPGDQVAVVHLGPLRTPKDGAWSLDDRWWQEPLWSADANAFVWSPDGTALYISTGGRGSGGVFRLDLRNRRAVRVWPNDEASTPEQGAGRSCEILKADAARRLLRVRYQPAATQRPIAVDVWMD